MAKEWLRFALVFCAVFVLDQWIKFLFVEEGLRWSGDYFSLILTYNTGVAFSLLAFLGPWLKVLQGILIAAIFVYLVRNKPVLCAHNVPLAILLGAGSSNLLDRFMHGGVVDYIFWHHWFEFAVFNFADVMINVAVGILLIQLFFFSKQEKKSASKPPEVER
jgi:signal peptidase II